VPRENSLRRHGVRQILGVLRLRDATLRSVAPLRTTELELRQAKAEDSGRSGIYPRLSPKGERGTFPRRASRENDEVGLAFMPD